MAAPEPVAAQVLIVHCTCPPAHADTLARTLVDAQVAACVSALPGVRSTYRWQGQVCQDDEVLLLIKTTAARFEALRETLLAHHPYELPEILAVPVAAGHAAYLDWVGACVQGPA